MDLLGALTDTLLREFFDELTLRRGQAYAAAGRVRVVQTDPASPDGVQASRGSVRGSRPTPYAVTLELFKEPDGLYLATFCSCPVQVDCKHGAALALELRNAASTSERGAPRWESSLQSLIRDLAAQLDTGDDGDRVPLALEISLVSPSRRRTSFGPGSTGPSLQMRPLRRGAKGGWVKSGADWREIHAGATAGNHPTGQLQALQRLLRSLQAGSPYGWSGYVPPLADFGDRLVEQLRDAQEAGVALLAGADLSGVRLLDDPVSLATELVRGPAGSTMLLGVEHDGRFWTGARVLPLGTPAHTVGLLDDGVLLLGCAAQPIPASALRLLGDAGVQVPPAQERALLGLLAPLARLLPVRSPDGSLELPEPIAPVLSLTVTWRSSTKAELTWEWRYDERRYRLRSREDLDLLRDRPAEREILARLPDGLVDRTEAEDGDALTLAIHDLPALRTLDGVEVVERERPDFREAGDAPEISFDLVEEPDAGTDWLDLAVTISVDGERIPLPDVLAALTLGATHLVLPSGLYVTTDSPELDRLRDVVAAAAELSETAGDRVSVGKHDLGIWAQLAELGVVDAQATEWVSRARALRDLTEIPRPEPVGLATELRHYQLEGFWWLAFLWQHRLGGILADDMGLGKTLQVLALVAHAVEHGAREPFLVVAPTSVVSAWETEAARHAPGLRVRAVARQTDDVAALACDADIVVTTYTLLRLQQGTYAGLSWAGLVLDEAHQVKNHHSKTYAAARTIEVPFRLAVTGTPFENRLIELWALLSLTTPGLYPWPRAFNDNVAKPVEKRGDERALRRFQQRIRPFVLRRTKDLVADDLPPKQEQVVSVELSPRHRRIYDAHLAKERQRILGLVDDFDRNRVAIFSALMKLRQLALDPALVDPADERVGSAKLDLLVEQLAEIAAEGHRALVFSQFTTYLARVRERLTAEGIATSYLDGGTRDRGAVIEEFRAGDTSVFLISLKAGGVGLTLTEADYVFVMDPWWNPAAEAQAVDRAHRIGQQRQVIVYRLIAEDTIEEKVMALKGRKAELFARVVDGEGVVSTGIDADDIRGLFED